MAAFDDAIFTEPRTRRVASSSNVKTAEDALALGGDHGRSILSKNDSSVAYDGLGDDLNGKLR